MVLALSFPAVAARLSLVVWEINWRSIRIATMKVRIGQLVESGLEPIGKPWPHGGVEVV
jgi:hypothetical protein